MGKATAQRREPREPAAGGGAAPKKRSPVHPDDDSDGDWSPTARGGSRARGAAATAAGPLPLRRKLGDGLQANNLQSNSDEVGGAQDMLGLDGVGAKQW